MIGQKNLIEKINIILPNYPKFSIITGNKGSGKRTLVKYICNKLGLPIVNFGTSIDEVREVIDLSYEQDKPICYVCADADNMSLGAKNSLLKITEEPPNNAYFMLTLFSLSNTLSTIESRATIFTLDNYTFEELIEYRKFKQYPDTHDNIIKMACTCTGDVDELFIMDVKKFYEYARLTAESIHIPNSGNVFKIPKALKIGTSEGFNPILFFRTVRNIYICRGIQEKSSKYLKAAQVTTECLRDLFLPTVSKLGTVDKWILDVRGVLRCS